MRKAHTRIWFLLLAFTLLAAACFAIPGPALAKDYVWTKVLLDVQVAPDGSMQVEETRGLRFEGNYHFAYIYIEKDQISNVDQVSVQETNGPAYSQSGSGVLGSFSLTDEGSRVTIRWNFDFADTERTWLIRYRINGAAQRGAISFWSDFNQLYFKFIGADHDRPMEQTRVTIHLPSGSTKEDFRAWGYGPPPGSGTVTIVDGQTVQMESPLGEGVGMEARVLFPASLMQPPSGVSRSSQAIYPQVQKEQQAIEEAARQARFWLDLQYIVAIAIALLGPALMIYLWWTKGREYRLPPSTAMISGPPTTLRPAGVDALWHQASSQKGWVATIFDLAHRGYLKMEQVAEDFRLTQLKQPDADTKNFESYLLGLLFGHSPETTLSALAHSLANSTGPLQKKIWAYLAPFRFFDVDPGKVRASYSSIGMLMLFGGIGLFVLQVFILGIALVWASLFVLGFGSAMPRRSYTGARELTAWKAFLQYMLELEKRPALKDSTSIFSQYLPYAIVFGIEDGWVASFSDRPDFFAPPWWVWAYAAYRGPGMGGTSEFTNALQHSFSDFYSRVSTAFAPERSSSSGGGGGGFSGGGGGGGGGGGSGAG
jgi:uncharacterized membrane protein